MGDFTFYGFITIGLIFTLFLVGIVEIVSNWFYENFIFNFLSFDIVNQAPLMSAFLDNMGLYAFLWAVVLILVNRMGFRISTFTQQDFGRFEE
jgi:hypothetical protein